LPAPPAIPPAAVPPAARRTGAPGAPAAVTSPARGSGTAARTFRPRIGDDEKRGAEDGDDGADGHEHVHDCVATRTSSLLTALHDSIRPPVCDFAGLAPCQRDRRVVTIGTKHASRSRYIRFDRKCTRRRAEWLRPVFPVSG